MKLKLPNAVTTTAGRTMLLASKNSPEILFAAGVVGVVGTVVLACRATLKVEPVLTAAEKELADATSSKEETKVRIQFVGEVVKLYGPAIVVGGLSIAALTSGHKIQQNRIAGLTAAYAALEKGFEQYRKRVVDTYGEDVDREMRYGAVRSTVVEETTSGKKKVVETKFDADGAKIYSRIFAQDTSRNWKVNNEDNKLFLMCQQNWANDRLEAYGHIFLNEVYDMLGLPRSEAGAVVGWLSEKHHGHGDGFVEFGIFENGNGDIRDYFTGKDGYLLDFNVDGVIHDKI